MKDLDVALGKDAESAAALAFVPVVVDAAFDAQDGSLLKVQLAGILPVERIQSNGEFTHFGHASGVMMMLFNVIMMVGADVVVRTLWILWLLLLLRSL